ncbi:MAG: Ig-like domain-containing protein, partial [Mycobacterium leprae]
MRAGKRLVTLAVVACLIFGLTSPTSASYTPANQESAGQRMQQLGILQGRPGEGLALDAEITRAELMTIIVRAFGQEQNAALLKGSTIFPDIANHWASGNIAMAVALAQKAGADPIGMPDGKFNPDGKLTPAQAVAFLCKFLGVKRDATKAWPNDYLSAAAAAGLINADDAESLAAQANSSATRGLVFYIFDRTFYSYRTPDGKTFYTKYVKTTPPSLTVDMPATTAETQVRVTGTVSSDAVDLRVNGSAVSTANGIFGATVSLVMGENPVTVTAADLAGNVTTKTLTITRTTGVATQIDVAQTLTLAVRETAALPVTVKDAAGNVIADAAVSVLSHLGTWATGQFTAGKQAGSETITVQCGAVTATVSVTVKPGALARLTVTPAAVTLAAGATQQFAATGADPYGNKIALTEPVSWSAAKGTMNPDGSFTATADAAGSVTVKATVGKVDGDAAVTVLAPEYRVVVSGPTALVATGLSYGVLTVAVMDAAGLPAKSYAGTILLANSDPAVVTLSASSLSVVNGVATFTVTSTKTPGTAEISLSGTNVKGTSVSIRTMLPYLGPVDPPPPPADQIGPAVPLNNVRVAFNPSGDLQLLLTFSEPTNAPDVTSADFVVKDAGGSTRTSPFGTAAIFEWDATKRILTITLDANPDLVSGDTLALANSGKIKDSTGNPVTVTTPFWTVDLTGPALGTNGVQVIRAVDGMLAQGDQIWIHFDEGTNAPSTLTSVDFTVMTAANQPRANPFGDHPVFAWDATKRVLTITAGTSPSMANGDSLALAHPETVTDIWGNPTDLGVFWTADFTPPGLVLPVDVV